MDCRKCLWMAIGLWGGVAGCQTPKGTTPPGGLPLPPAVPAAPVEKVETTSAKVADSPKKSVRPATCVAFADFKAVEANSPQMPQAMRDRLRDEAKQAYRDALTLDPNCMPAHRGLGRLYTAQEDGPRAIAAFEKAVALAPKDAAVWADLGLCQNHFNQIEPAIQSLTHAIELDGENRTYSNALAVVLARAGKFELSLECFARVNPEALAHFNLGCTLRKLGQEELARGQLEIALRMNPKLTSAESMLAEMQVPQQQAPQQAVETAGYTSQPEQPQPLPKPEAGTR